jgi:MYXO-CTERM domain-containing protein
VQADLDSIVTHEAGHFLGLSHSCDNAATMYANYKLGEVGLRTLEADDVAGICTLFPPGSDKACDPTPRHGFSTECCNPRSKCEGRTEPEGCCTTAPGSANSPGHLGLTLLLSGVLLSMARRRRRERPLRRPDAMG